MSVIAYLDGDHTVEAVAAMLARRHGILGEAVRNDGDENFPAWVRFTDRAGVQRTLMVKPIHDGFARHVGCGTEVSLGSRGDAMAIVMGILCETGGHVRDGEGAWSAVPPRPATLPCPVPAEAPRGPMEGAVPQSTAFAPVHSLAILMDDGDECADARPN